MLYGPPGTGKTQLAKAVAGEAQAAFMSIGPSDVLSKFVGESEQSIKALFEEAKNKAKRMESQCTVLFFDEIDALGISRNSGCDDGGGGGGGGFGSSNTFGGGGEQSARRILAELLIQLSNLSSCSSATDETTDEIDSSSDSDNGYGTCSDEATEPGKYNTIMRDIIVEEGKSERECFSFQNDRKDLQLHHTRDKEIQDDIDSKTDENSCPHLISPSSTSTSTSENLDNNRNCNPRVIVIAATNRPEDCDPALLRRFAIRVLIGLPTHRDRRKIISRLLVGIEHDITVQQLKELSVSLEGWSGSDLESVTREAVMAPVRECLRSAAIMKTKARKISNKMISNDKNYQNLDRGVEVARNELLNRFQNLRPVSIHDFELAISFWIGDGQDEMSIVRTKDALGSCHYDSDSTCEDSM